MGERPDFQSEIPRKAARKLKARSHRPRDVWFGLGMMGAVGWSVVVPAVAGTALGLWLDRVLPGNHPWTLTFLVFGLFIGCWTAWLWVEKERKSMEEKTKDE